MTAGSVVPVLLAVLAAGFVYEALQDRSSMTSVVVASSLVPAGTPVDASDTRTVRIHSSDTEVADGWLTPAELGGDWVATVAVRAGEPLTMSEVEKPSLVPALGEMSIAVPVQQAAGGRISAGDLVDVIASNGAGDAYYVAQGIRVLGVAPESATTGVLGGSSGSYFVVVAVNKQTALRIAAALGSQGTAGTGNDIEIVRSSGEAPTAERHYSIDQPVRAQPAATRVTRSAAAPESQSGP
ncbi:MAG TPA: SAF domain-containing protein [Acidimicrobiales bacterium]|nr:SAF domain-containing protein [Acidimicrobiales bacterium]